MSESKMKPRFRAEELHDWMISLLRDKFVRWRRRDARMDSGCDRTPTSGPDFTLLQQHNKL